MHYKNLITYLEQITVKQKSLTQYWIAIVGIPGSGKTTLAQTLKNQLGEAITIIPMDGYHHYRIALDAMPNPKEAYARRGAPFTFNVVKLVEDLIAARQSGVGSFPDFDHTQGDPVENRIRLNNNTKVVLVEGNYLLLNQEPWLQLQNKVFDESWYLDTPIHISMERLLARHIKTGLSKEQALHRIETNDRLNALFIRDRSLARADWIIQ